MGDTRRGSVTLKSSSSRRNSLKQPENTGNSSRRSSIVETTLANLQNEASSSSPGPHSPMFEPLDSATVNRIRNAAKLTEPDIKDRYREFMKQFPDGGISFVAFRALSALILEEGEVDSFTKRVFKMFDTDHNKFLTFEEFTLATEQQKGNPLYKLAWMFDHVYDIVSF